MISNVEYVGTLIMVFIAMIIMIIIEFKILFRYILYKDYIKQYKLQKHFYEWKKYNKDL